MYQTAGVAVCAVTTNSFGAALEIVGTATRYRGCSSAGTVATSSQLPGGNVAALVAVSAPATLTCSRPSPECTSRPSGSPARTRSISSTASPVTSVEDASAEAADDCAPAG